MRPPRSSRIVVLWWPLPGDLAGASLRAVEHRADLAVMRGHVAWWTRTPSLLVVHALRVQATTGALVPLLGAPTHGSPERTP